MGKRAQGTRIFSKLEEMTDEELADFFEEHDPLEFLEETEPAKLEAAATGATMVQVNFRLPQNALVVIKKLARHLGIGHTTLIRLWVMEKLYERLEEKMS